MTDFARLRDANITATGKTKSKGILYFSVVETIHTAINISTVSCMQY